MNMKFTCASLLRNALHDVSRTWVMACYLYVACGVSGPWAITSEYRPGLYSATGLKRSRGFLAV